MTKALALLPRMTDGGAERFFAAFLSRTSLDASWATLVPGPFDEELPAGTGGPVLSARFSSWRSVPLQIASIPKLLLLITRSDAKVLVSFGSLFNCTVIAIGMLTRRPCVVVQAVRQSEEEMGRGRVQAAVRRRLVRWTYRYAKTVVACSEGVAEDLVENYGVSRNVVVVYYGVDLEGIRGEATRESSPQGDYDVAFVGRLVPQKGVDLLLDAMSRLPERTLLIVGDGPLRGKLESLSRELGIADRVTFFGYQRAPYASMRRGRVFALPSRWEGFGIVLVEAMGMGLPTIAFDAPSGPREILRDGRHGVLVPPGDCEALAVQIERLLGDGNLSDHFAAESLKRADDFELTAIVTQYDCLVRAATA